MSIYMCPIYNICVNIHVYIINTIEEKKTV